MNNSDWFLIAVVTVAFIAGYSVVSFIVKAINSRKKTTATNEPKTDQSQQKEADSDPWEFKNKEERYAHVLGLDTMFAAKDVKRAYRELLAKYHPDKVNHLGNEFKSIAEIKTREIVEAYDYFRVKHDIR